MTNGLITSIGRQLNIPKSNDNEWICQVVYSVAGQMALASLWDHMEDESTVSVQHFKKRIAQVFDAYEGLYPEIAAMLPDDRADLMDEMYSIYLRSGHLYRSAYQVSPSAPARSECGGVVLHRGASPDARLFMSGLGFYSVSAQKSRIDNSIAAMFGLQEQPLESYLNELLEHGEWEPVDWPENAEFLRLDPPFYGGYWKQASDKDRRISLARYGEPKKIYVLYRYYEGAYQQKAIPQWRMQDYFSNTAGSSGEHWRIAAALLNRYGILPPIKASTGGDFVEIKLGYLLPPSEETFLKLYSWPMRYDVPQAFTRKMARQIYPVFKRELETIGYRFVEE